VNVLILQFNKTIFHTQKQTNKQTPVETIKFSIHIPLTKMMMMMIPKFGRICTKYANRYYNIPVRSIHHLYHSIGNQQIRTFAAATIANTVEESTEKTAQQLGFEYEKKVVQILNKNYSFQLKTTSKQSHDQGIDFVGSLIVSHWKNLNVPILGQCKRESKPIGVKYVRQLQGTLSQFNNEQFDTNYTQVNNKYIGVLISNSGYSIYAVRLAQQCSDGIILCTLNDDDEMLVYFNMNNAAKEQIGPQFIASSERSLNNAVNGIVFYELDAKGEPISLTGQCGKQRQKQYEKED